MSWIDRHSLIEIIKRQILFTSNDIGQSKAQKAKDHLKGLNPAIKIEIYKAGLTAENAPLLFDKYDIIIDGTDNFEAKYLINDTAVKYNKPWVTFTDDTVVATNGVSMIAVPLSLVTPFLPAFAW